MEVMMSSSSASLYSVRPLCLRTPARKRPTFFLSSRKSNPSAVFACCRPDDDEDYLSPKGRRMFRIRPDPPDWIPEQTPLLHDTHLNSHHCNGTKNKKEKKMFAKGVEHGKLGSSFSSSVIMALSSLMSMIRELKSHAVALQMGGGKAPPLDDPELQSILARVHAEMDASFYCLFRNVFSRTPSLMISLLLLLADFTVSKSFCLSSSSPADVGFSRYKPIAWSPTLGIGIGSIRTPSRSDGRGGFDEGQEPEIVAALEEEARLWKCIVDETIRIQMETRHPALMDHETLLSFVSPVTLDEEPDTIYQEYLHTDIMYQVLIRRDPENPMILSNYAQFLFQVVHDVDRAELYFKRAAEIKPNDAEALSRYAHFLWKGKDDLSTAEEMYLQAIDADPCNPTHHSDYAHFLWRTGAEDTCYPLDELGDA